MEGMPVKFFKLIFTVDYFIFMYLPGQCDKYQNLNVLFKFFKDMCLELILMDLYIEYWYSGPMFSISCFR